jgi:cyclophilin family peptidyl-prolyl cis-trans isomerase/predicted GIY-YIG superfamily endonuclease
MAVNRSRRAYVYVVACCDGSLYAGWTHDLPARLAEHAAGTASRYTRSRRPLALRAWWHCAGRREAMRDEALFKLLGRTSKLAALAGAEVFGRRLHKAPLLDAPPRVPPKGDSMPTNAAPTGAELDDLAAEAQSVQARIHTAKGDLVFRFYPHEARQHSAAFMKLARAGFYDGLTFHRVEPGFVVQGGCPNGTGTGGPGYNLAAEFSALPHVRGTVAMARAANPNSAGSQFYVCLGDARFLDRQYTVFGQLSDGLDVLDTIAVGDRMEKVTIEPLAAAGSGASG